jgi:hypothetical protein
VGLVDARSVFSGAAGHEEDPEQGGQNDAVREQHYREARQDHGDAEWPLGSAKDASCGARWGLDGRGLSVRP